MMKLTLVMAQTLDGKIAKNSNHFPDWTEKADKKFFMKRTKESGVMIFGKKTFDTLPGILSGRLHIVMTRKAREWEQKDDNLIYTNLSPKEILKKLDSLGFQNPILAGGTTINTLFAKENLIDEIELTLSPIIFGEGLGLFSADSELKLDFISQEKIGEQTLFLKYSVQK